MNLNRIKQGVLARVNNEMAELRRSGRISATAPALTLEDFDVVVRPRPGWAIKQDGGPVITC